MSITKNSVAGFAGGLFVFLLCAVATAAAQQRHVHYVDPLFGSEIDYDIYRYTSLVTVDKGRYDHTGSEIEKTALNAVAYIQDNKLDEWGKLNTDKVSTEQFKILQNMTGSRCQLYYHISYASYEIFIFYPSTLPMRLVLPFKMNKGTYRIDRSFFHTTFNKLLAHNNFDPFSGEKVYNMKCLSGFESAEGNKIPDYSGYQADIRETKLKSTASDYGQGVYVNGSSVSLNPAKDDPLFQNTFQVNARIYIDGAATADTALILSSTDRGTAGFLGIYAMPVAGKSPRLYVLLKDKRGKRYSLLPEAPANRWFAFSLSFAFNTAKVYIDKELKAELDIEARFDYEQAVFLVGKNAYLPYDAASARVDELIIGFE